jgi:probable HAF family extracellular repeat protein
MKNQVLLIGFLASATVALAQPRIVSLSSSPSTARAISANGQVIVGYLTMPSGNFHAFRWTQQTGAVDIAAGGSWTWSDAQAVSADGSVVVGTAIGGPPGWWWTQGTGQVAVTIPGYGYTFVNAVSADGQLIGGNVPNLSGTVSNAFVSPRGGSATILPSPTGAPSAYLYALSPDGTLGAGTSGNGGFVRGALWSPLTQNNFAGSLDGRTTLIRALTPNGSAVVGQIYDTALDHSAFLWTASHGGQELGNPPGITNSFLYAINAAGTLATGTSDNGTAPRYRAVVWHSGDPITDAASFLSARGVDLSGWTLEYIYGMTPDGRILVGGGIHTTPSGTQEEAFAVYLPCGDADFNGDGASGTDADIEAFFACISGNCCPTCGSADFNGDGAVGTDADIESFFRVLAGGNC